jgi:hypothetical protein
MEIGNIRVGKTEGTLFEAILKLKEAKDITYRWCFPWQPGFQFLQNFTSGTDPWLCEVIFR